MSNSSGDEMQPTRLALVLGAFLLPGAGVALLLWHEVVNRVLAGRPPGIPVWAILGLLAGLGLVVWALALCLRRLARDERS